MSKRKQNPLKEFENKALDYQIETRNALLDTKNIAIPIVGGIASAIVGLATMATGLGLVIFVAGGTLSFVAYGLKVMLDVAQETVEEKRARDIRRDLSEIEDLRSYVEIQLKEANQYRSSSDPLVYSDWAFQEKAEILDKIRLVSKEIRHTLEQIEFEDATRDATLPDVQRLSILAIRLYERWLYFLGTYLEIELSDDSKIDQLREQITALKRKYQKSHHDEKLKKHQQISIQAAEQHLRAMLDGIQNPERVLREVELIEADLNTIYHTLSSRMVTLESQLSKLTHGMSMTELTEWHTEVMAAVRDLNYTRSAEEEVSKLFEESMGIQPRINLGDEDQKQLYK